MELVDRFLTKMFRTNLNFVYTVTRDFVRNCQTPVLILPDDVPAHPYAVAMECAMLAPKAEVSMYPWKEPKRIPLAVRLRCARYVPSSGRIGLFLLRSQSSVQQGVRPVLPSCCPCNCWHAWHIEADRIAKYCVSKSWRQPHELLLGIAREFDASLSRLKEDLTKHRALLKELMHAAYQILT
jgi:hypothetical protein